MQTPRGLGGTGAHLQGGAVAVGTALGERSLSLRPLALKYVGDARELCDQALEAGRILR